MIPQGAIVRTGESWFRVTEHAGCMVEGTRLGKGVSGHFIRVRRDQADSWAPPTSARFWVWECGGWVRLTVRQGETIEHFEGASTDEGYASEVTRWTLEGCEVIREYEGWGRDCDGPHEFHCYSRCNVTQLGAIDMADPEAFGESAPVGNAGIRRPEWEDMSRGERHAWAEAAGY